MSTSPDGVSRASCDPRLPTSPNDVDQLRRKLVEAEETLHAIQGGAVDAVIVNGPDGNQVYTLKGAEHPYRSMIEQMNEGALTLTVDGMIIYCNRRFAEQAGRPIYKLIGRSISTLLRTDSSDDLLFFLNQARDGKRYLECEILGPDHRPNPVLISASPFEVEGHQNLCVTVTDLGPLRAARQESARLKEFSQELEQQVSERTSMLENQTNRLRQLALQLTDAEHRERKRLAELIHDHLQQLLVAAKMRIERLKHDESVHDSLPLIEEIGRLVQDAVHSARSLTMELRPPVLYEDGLVAAIQWLGQHTRAQYEIEVATCLDPHAEPVEDDVKAFLYQAVRELVFNAVKHAYINEICIIAEVLESGHIQVRVEDEGAGFDMAAVRNRQSNESMGLFSIQERTTALGGTMMIDSGPGIGTRVALTVPQSQPREQRVVKAPQIDRRVRRKEQDSNVTGAVRVMLVDDHQLVRDGIGNLLADNENIWVVGMADNGEEALIKAAELQPDVVVMDANMPVMNGIEATRNIRHAFPSIQVVGLSVQNDAAIAESFQQAGAAAFLSKDGDLHCLLETIIQCRERSRSNH